MLTDKLTSIAAAIREKGGTTELLTLDAMPTAIANLPTGGGGEGGDYVPNPIVYSGNCQYLFANGHHDWIMDNYYSRISFENVSSTNYMFSHSKVKKIPSITQTSSNITWSYAFSNATQVEEIGDIYNFYPASYGNMFSCCERLKHCPNFINPKQANDGGYTNNQSLFTGCYSLRDVSIDLMKTLYSKSTQTTYHPYPYMFRACASLDEIICLNPTGGTLTMNMFNNTFLSCYRLKRLTFNTNEDGTPIVVKWKKQTIDLSNYVGWAGEAYADQKILNYNSGITAEDEDNGRDTNPNYWTKQFGNSRFGHAAAVELINSLPDASAYLEGTTGSNNTVKFYSNAGSLAGDSVNALTEEEIAVAAAKGWTISYAS